MFPPLTCTLEQMCFTATQCFLWVLRSAVVKGLSLSARDPVDRSWSVSSHHEGQGQWWPLLAKLVITHRGCIHQLLWALHINVTPLLFSYISPLQETEQGRAGCVCSMSVIPIKVISLWSLISLSAYIIRVRTAGTYLDDRAAHWYCKADFKLPWSLNCSLKVESVGLRNKI